MAGLAIAAMVFRYVMGDDVEITDRVADGTRVVAGDVVMRVAGPTRGLLTAERTALNFASHLSGVATATSRWVEALEGTSARVLDTRKTLPAGGRSRSTPFAAVAASTTASRLADMAMVKDNHVIAAGGVVPALEAVRAAYPDLPIEVEVTDLDQLRELLDAGCDRILLDNMTHGDDGRGGRDQRRPRGARGIGRPDHRAGPRGGRDGRRLHLRRRADALGEGLRHRHGSGRGMTLLAADIGNSDTVLGLLDGEEVVAHWRVSTDERRTSDEWAVLVRGLLADADRVRRRHCGVFDRARRCCTNGGTCSARHFEGIHSVVVEPGVRTGVPVLMDNPREVGADRIINALAAASEFGGPAIVVDFGGTATTFDVVSANGQYIGGAIAPGIEISLEALGRRGAQLRKVELLRPRSVIAKNTVEALQSGMLFGVAAQVDGMVSRMIAELGVETSDVNVISTGHLAPLVRGRMFLFHRTFAVADIAGTATRLRAKRLNLAFVLLGVFTESAFPHPRTPVRNIHGTEGQHHSRRRSRRQ